MSVVTVEEAVRGRLAVLSKRGRGESRVRAYAKFPETLRFFATVQVVDFDRECEERFDQLRVQKVRIGSQDLHIAATAPVKNLVVVTRNRSAFHRVPGLVFEDWSK